MKEFELSYLLEILEAIQNGARIGKNHITVSMSRLELKSLVRKLIKQREGLK